MKRILFFIAIALCAASCYGGKFMSGYALEFNPHGSDPGEIARTRHKADSLLPGSTAWFDSLMDAGIMKDTIVRSYNGNMIYACYAPAKDPATANGTAIVVHGYGDNHFVFLYLVRMYRDDLNYNVLFPDLQYHGYSEGDHCQMGWFDRYDVEQWADVAHSIFKDNFTVLHGVSMGGATVMMASGDKLQPFIKAIVEDCGYASVVAQFNKNRRDSFWFVPADILQSASLVTKKKHGWGFWEASSVEQLKKSTVPMLFIHGDADDFVPFSHLDKCYNAKTQGYKEKWVAEGAVHANSFAKHPEEYKQHVHDFLEKVKGL